MLYLTVHSMDIISNIAHCAYFLYQCLLCNCACYLYQCTLWILSLPVHPVHIFSISAHSAYYLYQCTKWILSLPVHFVHIISTSAHCVYYLYLRPLWILSLPVLTVQNFSTSAHWMLSLPVHTVHVISTSAHCACYLYQRTLCIFDKILIRSEVAAGWSAESRKMRIIKNPLPFSMFRVIGNGLGILGLCTVAHWAARKIITVRVISFFKIMYHKRS